MKLGISIKLDVTKIDKSRIFQGTKGKYLDLTTFVDLDNAGEYGDHGFISQSLTKEEIASNKQNPSNKVQTPILGNTTVFYNDSAPQAPQQQAPQQAPPASNNFDDDLDIPF